ncbi:Hermansky-Pudlak syndrome 3 protein homolog [Thrips palmi]|uniref:Hermansky-Pudlak syndrome 3 protein homolog n=1 Tax=Thrips palmi TaxID=161013 RepID=A0A6P8YNL5_THRPL|nr:Hermansky-Pudlak syndrome 3 protein homolog [Thrips palmi]
MVRVLTAHHFASQDIQTCEDPVAVAAVPPDKLLIASADHVVEVRDLSKGGEAVSTFPTVDLVQHMAYCSTGNYVATLEGSPSGATGGQGCVARVYSRWDAAGAPAAPGAPGAPAQSQPMRARIAGCVTPSPVQEDATLDMIELPVRGRGGATALACCQATGNVLVACHRILVFFRYIVRTHESSRTRYIDFEDTEVRVSLSFPPTQAFLREELAVCMGKHSLLVFRLWHSQSQGQAQATGSSRQQENPSEAGQRPSNASSLHGPGHGPGHRPLNLNRILQVEQEVNSGRRVWGTGPGTGVSELGVSLPVTVQLPAIAAERASRGHCSPGSGVVHHSNPFVSDPADVAANVFAGSGAGAASDFQVEALLRLQLAGDPQGGHGEEFGCLTLQPLYRREPAASASPARASTGRRQGGQGSARQTQSPTRRERPSGPGAWLSSRHRAQLCGVACLVATQQEGYLYHFPMDGSAPAAHPCVAVYPFTAPVSRVVLEPLALHALTDTGLETYTLRSAHRSLAALQGVCPPADDPICLIGLRPFLGARHLLASGPHLVLLATSESSSPPVADAPAAASPWTLYSLRLPTPEVLFSDMVAVGESHRVASPSTYCHLLGEAHCVLASARHLSDQPGATASPVAKVLDESEEALQALYRESCAYLGDFHVMSDDAADRDLAARYYRMARMEPQRVLDRMAKHAQRLGQPVDHNGHRGQAQDDGLLDSDVLCAQLHRGQVHYLEAEVLEARQGPSGEPLDDQGARQLTSQLLELLEKRREGDAVDPVRLATLVLRARLLREYAASRTLALLRSAAPPSAAGKTKASVVLALLLLEVQVGGVASGAASAAEVLGLLQALPSATLLPELARHWELLLDGQGLSELATVLMERRPADMAALLAQLVEADTMPLARILKMMLDHLSTQIGSSGSGGSVVSVVFQRFLEAFFASFFAANAVDCLMDLATEEALKILVRSYLSDLQTPPAPPSSPGSLAAGARLEPLARVLLDEDRLPFLDAMPPFAADLSERLASPVKHAPPPPQHGSENKKLSLRKLQAVLCSSRLPRACVMEVLRFVRSQPKLFGNLSLQALCLPVREAVAVLLDFCPQAVLRYAQDLFRTEDDWRHLLAGLDTKRKTHSQNQALSALYQQTMTDVLDHLAHSVDVDTLCRLLHLDVALDVAGADLDVVRAHLPHLHTCQRVAGANAVRNYIASTSAAFLSQLDH